MSTGKKKDAQVRDLRRRGLELASQNQFHKAAQVYLELIDLEPEEGEWAKRAADCFWQLKDHTARLKYSVRAAEAFCDGGFLLKAIAMCKVVLTLDPSHQETQERLAQLYAKRPETSRDPLPHSFKTVTVEAPDTTRGPTIELPTEQKDARRARARLAAALALRRIRAQRKAAQQEWQDPTSVEPKPAPPSSHQPISLGSPLAPRPHPEPAPSAPPIAPPRVTLRAPSLHAISLHAHLPSQPRSLTPTNNSTAYSISLSQLPPPDVIRSPALPSFIGLGASLPPGMELLDPTWSSYPETLDDPDVTPSEFELDWSEPSNASQLTDEDQRDPMSLEPSWTDDLTEPSSILDEHAVMAQFESIPLFSALGHASLLTLINGLELVELEPGQVLFEDGDLADSMYVVSDGTVSAEVDRSDGAPLTLAELHEGQFFGEIGLLSDQPRQARVRAKTACRLLRLERQLVADLMAADATFLATLIAFLRDRLVANVVHTSPLFAKMPLDQGMELAARFEFLELEEDTALLEPGVRPLGMYVLLAGTAFCYRPKGRPQLAELGPGAIFGEAALLRNNASNMEVRTTSKCFALFLDGSQFRELIMTHPTVLEFISTLDTAADQGPYMGDHATLF